MQSGYRSRGLNPWAVSEVLGTILILMVTVVMFSTVMVWVLAFPPPLQKTYTDLRAELNTAPAVGGYVNITHIGGESLGEDDTVINMIIDGSTNRRTISDSIVSLGSTFDMGETWSNFSAAITSTSTVQVVVIDTTADEIVYIDTLQAVGGNNTPIIGLCIAEPNSVPADGSTTFTIYIYVIDQDYDVQGSNVRIDLSAIYRGVVTCTGADNIFQTSSLTVPDNLTSAAYRTYLFPVTVTDDAGHTAYGNVTFTVTAPTSTDSDSPEDWVWGESGPDGDQGFIITDAMDSDIDMRTFDHTDTLYVKVASNILKNLNKKNIFVLRDVNGTALDPPTKSTDAFETYDYSYGFYYYVCSFAVQNINGFNNDTGGIYNLRIELKDTEDHIFLAYATIFINNSAGVTPIAPCIRTYSEPTCLDGEESTTFNSTDMMYVKIWTYTTGPLAWATAGDVEIVDYWGRTQLKRSPGHDPVSALTTVGGNYSFAVNLSRADQTPWFPGTNTYTLYLRTFKDENPLGTTDEYYENLALQVRITAPITIRDIVVGVKEYQHPVFDVKYYAMRYANDNLWTRYQIEGWESIPGSLEPEWGEEFMDIAFGDIDGDLDLDAVTGSEEGYVMYYKNLDGDGEDWGRNFIDTNDNGTGTNGKIIDVTLGDMDSDNDLDIVVCTDNKFVFMYLNDGNWTRSTISSGSNVYSVEVGDVEDDDDTDIIIGGASGDIYVYLNQGDGTFGTVSYVSNYTSADLWTPEGNITNNSHVYTHSSNDSYEELTEEQIGNVVYDSALSETTVNGSVIAGAWWSTHVSDNNSEVIEEELTGGTWSNVSAQGEQNASKETVTNSFWQTKTVDGVYENLTEGTLGQKIYLGTAPYHVYNMGVLAAGDTVVLSIESKISVGDEYFEVGHSPDRTTITWLADKITHTGEARDIWVLPSSFAGNQLYIHIKDETDDNGDNELSGDSILTTLSIDYIDVNVTTEERTLLSHIWEFNLTGGAGATVSFVIEANRTANTENDNFTFEYSLTDPFDANPDVWTYMLTVSNTTDDDTNQTYADATLDAHSGDIWVRVNDTDRSPGNGQVDSIYIDQMYLRTAPSTLNSSLRHYWTVDVAGGNVVTVYVEAYRGDDTDVPPDNFSFYYSRDNTSYTYMFTANLTSDPGSAIYQYSDATLNAHSGTLYIMVNDTDDTLWNVDCTTLYVDHIFIMSTSFGPTFITINTGGADITSLALGDVRGDDGYVDIVAGDSSGQLWIANNTNGNGQNWATAMVGNLGDRTDALAVVNIVGDSRLDIVVGTYGKYLGIYENKGTSWDLIDVKKVTEVPESPIYCLDVGDVNGDGDVDIVIGTSDGYIYYFENEYLTLGEWSGSQVDYIEDIVWGIALGDTDG